MGVQRFRLGSEMSLAALGTFLRAARDVKEHGTFTSPGTRSPMLRRMTLSRSREWGFIAPRAFRPHLCYGHERPSARTPGRAPDAGSNPKGAHTLGQRTTAIPTGGGDRTGRNP